MAIRPALRNVLEIVGRLAHYDINTNVVDTSVVQHCDSHSSLASFFLLVLLNKNLGFIVQATSCPAILMI